MIQHPQAWAAPLILPVEIVGGQQEPSLILTPQILLFLALFQCLLFQIPYSMAQQHQTPSLTLLLTHFKLKAWPLETGFLTLRNIPSMRKYQMW
ncbi:hypothetical protein TH59_14520 [Pantoea ananatis]|nr:hypothetical protein [Pantoea ananatis]PKC40887.1 hypothetical protein V461_19840 [Pantoea ananatis BRT98]MDC7867787.1 hypothetical protein [Pantoea ananatis]NQE76518.1 hypothetical protein [Pantoea ananatis]NQE81153.1 hypothetical protein [Pantoea ananatis]